MTTEQEAGQDPPGQLGPRPGAAGRPGSSPARLPAFKDPSLLVRALTHRSYLNEHSGSGEDNERLEFLGDAVLDFLSGAFLYNRYPELPEGRLTRMRSALVRTEPLADLARTLDLGAQLRLGKGEHDSGGRERPSLLCAAFEAMVGAYFLDSGLEAVRAFVEPLFKRASEEIIFSEMEVDAKSEFQEWAQAEHRQTPRYQQVSATGPDHSREYTVEVFVDGESFGTGSGPNKAAATQKAAEAALKKVGRR
ncbi:MAG: ribonuclease III [Anaerolineales bacterium]